MPDTSGAHARPAALRLWPGVLLVVLQWLIRYVLPGLDPGASMVGVVGAIAGGVLVLGWWLFFSRARWPERLGAVALMAIALVVTFRLVHESIATGMMGFMLPVYAVPLLSLALVGWAAAARSLAGPPRLVSLVAAIALACAAMTAVRSGGISGDAVSDLHWRWTSTPEERLLAASNDRPSAVAAAPGGMAADADVPPPAAAPTTAAAPASETRRPPDAVEEPSASTESEEAGGRAADWPGFRGPDRDGVARGVRIATDWTASPPVQLWRRAIGPGWSSFAVHRNVIYTQEQRGAAEIVSAYTLATGAPRWTHRDATRFWESNGGAGPRGTPTFSRGRLYTFGATGIMNALDARNGAVAWSRDVGLDTHTRVPTWGFASSPLVLGDTVVIAAAGTLAAYDAATGAVRWIGARGHGGGYSSPQLSTIDGVEQIVLASASGAVGVAPSDGTLLWQYKWDGDGIVQPAVVSATDVLIGSGSGLSEVGVRRLAVTRSPAGWAVRERWTSSGLKPYFNDFVVHGGYAYGFDGSLLACIDLADGKRVWKGGRYGHGQLILLPEQDLLLVLSEEGQLALVGAAADQFTERARMPVFDGKTWNHPVLVGDVLLLRNGEEMAAFRLPVATP